MFRHLLDRIPWETVLKGIGVQEGWALFKKEVLMAQEQVAEKTTLAKQGDLAATQGEMESLGPLEEGASHSQ